MYYRLIDEHTIEKFKNPLRVENKHIFTNNETILNEHGVYKYIEDEIPELTESQYYETYYYVTDKMIHKGYLVKEFEPIVEFE